MLDDQSRRLEQEPMAGDTQTIFVSNTSRANWIIRFRLPESTGPHPILIMLHGWTGDEYAMWVFASRLPKNYLILAPRGLFKAPSVGYGWHPHEDGHWPTVDDFVPAVEALLELVDPDYFPIRSVSPSALEELRMVGFSQGAAFMYAFSLLNSSRIASIAGLSGFLPIDMEKYGTEQVLKGKTAFISHGSTDKLVHVDKAHQAVDFLRHMGANVTYCEDEVGHKLSGKCFRGLENFFARELYST